jgi:hypothetical protein
MKTNLGQICHREGCGLQVPSGLEPEGLCLDHYLEIAFQRLRNVSERVHQEQDTDRGTIVGGTERNAGHEPANQTVRATAGRGKSERTYEAYRGPSSSSGLTDGR